MIKFLARILGGKTEWKAMEARADALPRDYRVVYGEMKSHLWRFTTGDGMDIVALLKEVVGLFKAGVAQGRSVLDVTGPDVAAFCQERLRGTTSGADGWHRSLNRDVAEKLAE